MRPMITLFCPLSIRSNMVFVPCKCTGRGFKYFTSYLEYAANRNLSHASSNINSRASISSLNNYFFDRAQTDHPLTSSPRFDLEEVVSLLSKKISKKAGARGNNYEL